MDLGASRRSRGTGGHADSAHHLDLADACDHAPPPWRWRFFCAASRIRRCRLGTASRRRLSLAAIYGQTKKYVESWWLWISADLIYIPLYIYKHLRLTSGLYFVFLLLCVMGLREWSKALRTQARAGARIGSATIGLMEVAVQIHVESLPEGVFLATSEQLPGLVAQGRTVAETLEIARRRRSPADRSCGGNAKVFPRCGPAAENRDIYYCGGSLELGPALPDLDIVKSYERLKQSRV